MMYRNNFVAVIKCAGRILRERDNGNVYLPFGSEYSVLLKNKDCRRALVEIEVDGINVLNGHKLIIGGNEEQEITGFMRDMNKTNRFKFIHKTKEIQDHRGDRIDDGLIRVSYQFEEVAKPVIYYPNTTPVWPPFDTFPKYTYDYTYGGTSGPLSCGGSLTSSCNYVCDNSMLKSAEPHSDEGITVKGSEVKQGYSYGSVGMLDCDITTIVLHLRGVSGTKKAIISKPLTVRSKIQCSTCGRKNRSSNKFCYNCGTFLN